jgi:hypothetical protein
MWQHYVMQGFIFTKAGVNASSSGIHTASRFECGMWFTCALRTKLLHKYLAPVEAEVRQQHCRH